MFSWIFLFSFHLLIYLFKFNFILDLFNFKFFFLFSLLPFSSLCHSSIFLFKICLCSDQLYIIFEFHFLILLFFLYCTLFPNYPRSIILLNLDYLHHIIFFHHFFLFHFIFHFISSFFLYFISSFLLYYISFFSPNNLFDNFFYLVWFRAFASFPTPYFYLHVLIYIYNLGWINY